MRASAGTLAARSRPARTAWRTAATRACAAACTSSSLRLWPASRLRMDSRSACAASCVSYSSHQV